MEKYKGIPEEFYTATGLPAVTPHSIDDWLRCVCPPLDGLVDFQELFSGPGRMSLGALAAGLAVGFPVDFRYGWDLGISTHQELLPNLRENCTIGVTW